MAWYVDAESRTAARHGNGKQGPTNQRQGRGSSSWGSLWLTVRLMVSLCGAFSITVALVAQRGEAPFSPYRTYSALPHDTTCTPLPSLSLTSGHTMVHAPHLARLIQCSTFPGMGTSETYAHTPGKTSKYHVPTTYTGLQTKIPLCGQRKPPTS